MYRKVHLVGGNWYRCDTGTLVGEDVKPFEILEPLRKGHQFFACTPDGNFLVVYHGYYKKKGEFVHFCSKSGYDCIICNTNMQHMFCEKLSNKRKILTGGFYIKDTN